MGIKSIKIGIEIKKKHDDKIKKNTLGGKYVIKRQFLVLGTPGGQI